MMLIILFVIVSVSRSLAKRIANFRFSELGFSFLAICGGRAFGVISKFIVLLAPICSVGCFKLSLFPAVSFRGMAFASWLVDVLSIFAQSIFNRSISCTGRERERGEWKLVLRTVVGMSAIFKKKKSFLFYLLWIYTLERSLEF